MSDNRPRQLPLSVRLDDSATFNNFYSTNDINAQVLSALGSLRQGRFIYLWGNVGAGCSHLLQACCHQFAAESIYLPLDQLKEEDPAEVLMGIEQIPLVALDHLDQTLAYGQWAEQLFYLYNHLVERQGILLVAAQRAPMEIESPLADLKSRLSAMEVHRVVPLCDKDKVSALILRAANRGLDMPDTVAQYLLTHYSRDMSDQICFLDQLDEASLEKQRKLSIPLIKQVLHSTAMN